MLILLGYLVVPDTVFGGYLVTGGNFGALYQPVELVIIIGARIGSLIIGDDGKTIRGTLKALPLLFRRSKYTKAMYMDLLALPHRSMAKSRQIGMLSLRRDIGNLREGKVLANYPHILANSVILEFIVDYLRLIISGHIDTFKIETLIDGEVRTHENEAEVPASSLALVKDPPPALSIIAAVMEVVHVLGLANHPATELGVPTVHAIAGAFLDILSAYGFTSPLVSVLRQKGAETSKVMQRVRVTLLSNLDGYALPITVRFSHKTLYSSERSLFIKLEKHARTVRNPQQQATTEEARRIERIQLLSSSDAESEATGRHMDRGRLLVPTL